MTTDTLNKPYDSVFKSVIHKSPHLVLPLVNEMFFKTGLISSPYIGSEKVTLLNKELPGISSNEKLMDLLVSISGHPSRIFHLECQSVADDTMVLRMVQYDIRSAIDAAEYGDYQIDINVNDSGVLFLRTTEETPDFMTVNLIVPQANSVSYKIPVIKLRDYSLDLLLENKLYVLFPFIFFNYEKLLKSIPANQAAFDEVSKIFQELMNAIGTAFSDKQINAYEASTIYEAAKVVLSALGKKAKARKEVDKIMSAQILEFSADKYYNAGKAKWSAEALDLYGTLITELNRLGRSDDIIRSATDSQYRNQLFDEFHLVMDNAE